MLAESGMGAPPAICAAGEGGEGDGEGKVEGNTVGSSI